MANTTNLDLAKPAGTDQALISVLNGNTDKIDAYAGCVATVVNGATNNSGHTISSGEYFIANGAKRKASSTIGTGSTWSDKSTSVSDHDLINALNSKIANVSGSITKADGTDYISEINIVARKVAGLFVCTGFFKVNNSIPVSTLFAKMNGIVPSNNIYGSLFKNGGNVYAIIAKPNGNIEADDSAISTGYYTVLIVGACT